MVFSLPLPPSPSPSLSLSLSSRSDSKSSKSRNGEREREKERERDRQELERLVNKWVDGKSEYSVAKGVNFLDEKKQMKIRIEQLAKELKRLEGDEAIHVRCNRPLPEYGREKIPKKSSISIFKRGSILPSSSSSSSFCFYVFWFWFFFFGKKR